MADLQKRMVKDLQRLGVRAGGALLVHSSLRSLGSFSDRAQIALSALQQVVGSGGALLLPALSYETVTPRRPFFDVEHTPSCVGALTEVFRQRADVLRSVHPTHSVCGWGDRAASLLEEHGQGETPCGPHSPFYKLREAGGQILFIGCGLRPNTSMHGVEELVEPAYLFAGYTNFHIRLPNGGTKIYHGRVHDFYGWKQRYDRLEKVLAEPELRKGKILEADCFLVEAAPMWDKAERALREDPLYFVEKGH